MSLNILNSNKKSSCKAKILPQFSISSKNKPLLDLLEIQRKSFFDFLQHGIPDELAKIAVFRETAKNSTCKQELELKFNPETYKFISPNFTPKEAILNGKTYACKVYVQATLLIRSPYDIQKTNLFSVVTQPTRTLPDKSSSLNPPYPKGVNVTLNEDLSGGVRVGSATCKGLREEKMKQKSNFHPSFNDKNKRLNANKLLHNTYTKWLQSPFVYHSSSLTLSPFTCDASLLTSNLCKGSETEKQRRGFYSLLSATDSSALQTLQGTRVKAGTSQLLHEPTHYKYKSTICKKICIPHTHAKSSICKELRSKSVTSWGFVELHIRFAKAYLRQCWLPLSKTLLSKKLHIGLFANSFTPSGTSAALKGKPERSALELLANPHISLTQKLRFSFLDKSSHTLTPLGYAKSNTNLRFSIPQRGKRVESLNPPYPKGVNVTLNEDLSGNEMCGQTPHTDPFGVKAKSKICMGLATCRGLRRGMYASQLRKKKDYLSIPTGSEATQNIQIFRPWIFLGELPLMTKRGHFILNGSPRVIVNQIARCPGIYFQEKRRGVGIEQEIRVSADLIPQRGPWLRIQSDWEGRFWARLKQEGRVKYATLYEAFQEFEKEYNPPLICLLSNSYFTNTTSSLFSKSENITFQERKIKEDRQKKALIRLFKNPSRYSLGKLGRSRVNERIHSSFTRPSHSATQAQKGLRNWQGKEEIAQLRGLLKLYPKGAQRVGPPNNRLITSNYATPINYTNNSLTNRKNISQILGSETGSLTPSGYAHTLYPPSTAALVKAYTDAYPKREFPTATLNAAGKELRYFFNEGYSLQTYDLLSQQHQELRSNCGNELRRNNEVIVSTNCANAQLPPDKSSDKSDTNLRFSIPQRGKRVESLNPLQVAELTPSGLRLEDLSEDLNGYPKGSVRVGSSTCKGNCVNELMAKDLDAIHTCLERLLEGQGFTDDIDNLKNRFIRTSGKLLQQQFELGLFRLNEVITPLLGNLLPDYPRLTKSKYSTTKNIKENNSALQDTTLVDQLKPVYGVKSTRVLSTSNNYNKDDTSHTLTPLRSATSSYKSGSLPSLPTRLTNRRFVRVLDPIQVAELTPSGLRLFTNRRFVSDLSEDLASVYPFGVRGVKDVRFSILAQPTRYTLPHTQAKSSICKGLRRGKRVESLNPPHVTLNKGLSSPVRSHLPRVSIPRGVWGTATLYNNWQSKKGLLPRCVSQQLRGQKLFTSSLLRVLAEPRRGKYENFIYLREAEMKKSVTDGYKKEVSLIKNAPFRWLRTSKPINSAFREFFGSNPLSQYMDQTNPLAEITHKRRLSSMGPGGIKRETAGMEVRGIHPTHYGRVCPIETPEGKNAGLVNSPTVYGRVGHYGFLETPLYQVIENQVQTKRWTFFSAQYEERQNSSLATCDTGLLQFNFLAHVPIPVQTANNPLTHFQQVERHRVGYRALSPIQTISIATALIPFLEHDDANRALMGSNMQRQAIPLLSPERPIVGTGFEPLVVMESGQALQATKLGCVSQADANSIVIHTRYSIEKPLSQNILQNSDLPWSRALVHRFGIRIPPVPQRGKRMRNLPTRLPLWGMLNLRALTPHTDPFGVKAKSKICMGLPTCKGLRRGMRERGNAKSFVNKKHISYSHNTFLLRPLKQDLQFYERSNQETCLNQRPLVQEGDWIQKGDFLADSSASRSGDLALGKNVTVAYMPWEGYNFEDAIVISDRLVSDDIYTSLHIERYEIKVSKNSQGKERITNRVPGSSDSLKHLDNFGIARVSSWVQPGDILVGKVVELKRPLSPYERLAWELASRLSPKSPEREKWLNKVWLEDISLRLPPGVCGRVINSQIISTEYASMSDLGILAERGEGKYKEQTIYPQEVHVYLAVKRKIQIGDKLAGRHGNKGIVSAILPQEDMPYLGDGSCIDMVLNPLGVPSRMNLGQIFECLLGLAGSQLGCNFRITPFDEIAGGEASRSLVFLKLYQCRLMYKQQWLFTPTFPGKSKLFDGRTGEPFENWVTVGQAYMLKLIHMVDHKIHARSTGPYSLFTRQPVRGRSRRGGQRLGEMEVWAVEGFGAAYTLQEFLTIKSDDLKARTALQKGFYKQNDVTFGKIHIAPGNPEAFKVLVSELQALCLHIQM